MCRETLAKLILERRHHLHGVGDTSADRSRPYTATHPILACARSAALVAWFVHIRLENCMEYFGYLLRHRSWFDAV